jgi:hypothetical protein
MDIQLADEEEIGEDLHEPEENDSSMVQQDAIHDSAEEDPSIFTYHLPRITITQFIAIDFTPQKCIQLQELLMDSNFQNIRYFRD